MGRELCDGGCYGKGQSELHGMLLAVPASPAFPHETLFFPCALLVLCVHRCVGILSRLAYSLLAAVLQKCQPTTTKTTATPQPIPSFLLDPPTLAQSADDTRKAAGKGFRNQRQATA